MQMLMGNVTILSENEHKQGNYVENVFFSPYVL